MDGTTPEMKNQIINLKILQLKKYFIPKGLVPFEHLFNKNDVNVNLVVHTRNEYVKIFDIGTQKDPRYIKLSKFLTIEQKNMYVTIFKEYIDFFT